MAVGVSEVVLCLPAGCPADAVKVIVAGRTLQVQYAMPSASATKISVCGLGHVTLGSARTRHGPVMSCHTDSPAP